MQISSDHNIIGLGVDKKNNEEVQFYFRKINESVFLRDRLYDCSDVAFMNNNKGVYYVQYDIKHRNYIVKTHLFGEVSTNDQIVFEETDESYSVAIHLSKDK